mmetsp:Transcript_31859/g.73191  ORF Transcript_31859/g.73191 Transcript_31859/m.73191 type:complete len:220 (+) Transcript_31859:237-896(+)
MYHTLYQRVLTTVSLCAVLLYSCQPELKVFQEDPPHAQTLPSRTGHSSSHPPRTNHPSPYHPTGHSPLYPPRTDHPSAPQATPPPTLAPLVYSDHATTTAFSSIAPFTTPFKPLTVVKINPQKPADPSPSATPQAPNNFGSLYSRPFTTSSGDKVYFGKANGILLYSLSLTQLSSRCVWPVVRKQSVSPFSERLHALDRLDEASNFQNEALAMEARLKK